MRIVNCFDKIKNKKVQALQQRFNSLVPEDTDMSEAEQKAIGQRLAIEYHNNLITQANELKQRVDPEIPIIQIEDNADKVEKVTQKYDKLIDKKKGTVTGQEVRKAQRHIRDEAQQRKIRGLLDDFLGGGAPLTIGGIDPDKLAKGTKVIAAYIESGVHKFSDIIEDVYAELGDVVKDIFDALKTAYGAYYNSESISDADAELMDASVRGFTYDGIINNIKAQPFELIEQNQPERIFIDTVKENIAQGRSMNIVALRKLAEELGIDVKDTTLNEMVEVAVVELSRNVAESKLSDEAKLEAITEIYNNQPTIAMRSAERIEKQQYSTPSPMAFAAGHFVNKANPESVFEPSAGNGIMLINFPPHIVTANEIDEVRLDNLAKQNFSILTNQDALQPFPIGKKEGIVMNPPFGSSPEVSIKGYKIGGLDEKMIINALEHLAPDGRAAIIMGGHNRYDEKGRLISERIFFNYLYHHYNVADVINMDGNLYQKQGTTFPTRMILIDGVKQNPTGVAPTGENGIVAKSFKEIFDRANTAEKKIEKEAIPFNAINEGDYVEVHGINPKTNGKIEKLAEGTVTSKTGTYFLTLDNTQSKKFGYDYDFYLLKNPVKVERLDDGRRIISDKEMSDFFVNKAKKNFTTIAAPFFVGYRNSVERNLIPLLSNEARHFYTTVTMVDVNTPESQALWNVLELAEAMTAGKADMEKNGYASYEEYVGEHFKVRGDDTDSWVYYDLDTDNLYLEYPGFGEGPADHFGDRSFTVPQSFITGTQYEVTDMVYRHFRDAARYHNEVENQREEDQREDNDDVDNNKNKNDGTQNILPPGLVPNTGTGNAIYGNDTGNSATNEQTGVSGLPNGQVRPTDTGSNQPGGRPGVSGTGVSGNTPVQQQGDRDSAGIDGDNGLSGQGESVFDRPEPTGDIGGRSNTGVQRNVVPTTARSLGDLTEKPKTEYLPKSKASFSVNAVIPSPMASEMERVLTDFENRNGPVDDFVMNKLDYPNKEELFKAFSAEQIDALSLAIEQIDNGEGMIIGDQTGLGKGRIAAGVIRYGTKLGLKPIFLTYQANLFSDFYRDLVDIGSGELVPFIINGRSSGNTNPDIIQVNDEGKAKVIHTPLPSRDQKRAIKTGVINNADFIMSTYSQFQTNTAIEKRGFLLNASKGNILVLDESHIVSGSDSNVGALFQEVLAEAKGVTYLSATFAKKPENMPVYALKTAMREASMNMSELISAIKHGGVALQEIVGAQLVESGQMMRRESQPIPEENLNFDVLKDFTEEHSKAADEVTAIMRDVIDFQETYVKPIIEMMDDEAVAAGERVTVRGGTNQAGVNNTPFANKIFQVVHQLLFSIKAEAAAQEVVKALNGFYKGKMVNAKGLKPVIAFNSTMGSFMKHMDLHAGEILEKADFAITLNRALDGVMRYTVKDEQGNPTSEELSVDELSPMGQKMYKLIRSNIATASSGITISPIDAMIDVIEKAGYTAREITGRDAMLKKNADGTYTVETRKDKNKGKTISDFNNGDLDVILFNQSGSTGTSLHASEKFKDQRQRIMFIVQNQLDISTAVQTMGRTDRVGQIVRSLYSFVVSNIPAEQRLLMMFKKKLKSLNANATADQKSKEDKASEEIEDFLNKYGDQIVFDYLLEEPTLNSRMMDPLKILQDNKQEGDIAPEDAASKVTGKVALLPVVDQEKFYTEISERFKAEMKYLEDNNSNDLEVKVLPLNATTLEAKTVIVGNGNGPFGADTILEKVEIDVLKQPLTKAEIDKETSAALNGKTPEEISIQLTMAIEDYYDEQIVNETIELDQRYKDKEEDTEARVRQKAEDEQWENVEQEVVDALERLNFERDEKKTRVETKYERVKTYMVRMANGFKIDGVYDVPTAVDANSITGSTKAVFLGFNIKESRKNPYAPSAVTARFAVNDGRRMVSIPLSKTIFINAVLAQTHTNIFKDQAQEYRNNWDDYQSQTTRKVRYIITGNILQGFATNRGHLISYTTDTGEMKKGMLLTEDYQPSQQRVRIPIGQAARFVQRAGSSITTIDRDVTIRHTGSQIAVEVPKSRSKGAKYFLDSELRQLVNSRGFNQQGDKMVGFAEISDLQAVLDYFNNKHNSSIEVDGAAPGAKQFAVSEPTSEEIQEMTEIVHEQVDNGTSSLAEIQKTVAQATGDNSLQMKNLVEGAFTEYTKQFTPEEITKGVIKRVADNLSAVFGIENGVTVLATTEDLLTKADELSPDLIQFSLSNEQKEILASLEAAQAAYRTAKTNFDKKRKELDSKISEDATDLFGQRKAAPATGLFDERVDAAARDKAILPFKEKLAKAETELNRLQKKFDATGPQTAQQSLFQYADEVKKGTVLTFTIGGPKEIYVTLRETPIAGSFNNEGKIVHTQKVANLAAGFEYAKNEKAIFLHDFQKNKNLRFAGGNIDTGGRTTGSILNEQEISYNGKKTIVKPVQQTAEIINGFYSPIENAIINLPANKWGSGQQLLTEIKKQKGVKQDELGFTGIEDWLSQQKNITKAEALNYIRNNRIKLVEVVKTGTLDGGKTRGDKMEEIRNKFWKAGYDLEQDYISKDGELIEDWNDLPDDLPDLAEEYYNLRDVEEDNGNAQYPGWRIPGESTNYKEVLTTAPPVGLGDELSDAENNLNDAKEKLDEKSKIKYKQRFTNLSHTEKIKLQLEYPKTYEEFRNAVAKNQEVLNKKAKQFTGQHWDEPNVIAHTRMSTRKGSVGEKVVIMEDSQSDWGQKGRDIGFVQEDKGELQKQLAEAEKEYNKLDFNKLSLSEIWATPEAKKVELLKEKLKGLAAGPFVTNTTAWTKLNLKVALQHAIAEGADRLAWITGEQAADMFSLEKQVDKITVSRPSEDGKSRGYYHRINITDKKAENTKLAVDQNGKILEGPSAMFGKPLQDVVGKDMAEKIMNVKEGNLKEFSGLDLRIGGEGMRSYYGTPTEGRIGIMGNVAKDLIKELTGKEGVIGETKIKVGALKQGSNSTDWNNIKAEVTKDYEGKYHITLVGDKVYWILRDGSTPDTSILKAESITKFDTEKEAKDFAKKYIIAEREKANLDLATQHSIEITPELKAAVQGGMPMFMRSPEGKVLGMTAGNKIYLNGKHLNPNTPIHENYHLVLNMAFDDLSKVFNSATFDFSDMNKISDYVNSGSIVNDDESSGKLKKICP